MSYQRDREEFIARMTREGLPLGIARALLRGATTLQRNAELACSSEAADRDRVDCPASPVYTTHPIKRLIGKPRKVSGPCLCDVAHVGDVHEPVTRIAVQDARIEARLAKLLAGVEYARNTGHEQPWQLETAGDPRGYTLRVIPPSYGEMNKGRDRQNRESIGVPARESRLRF